MIEIRDKTRCSGCGSCAQRCPSHAIFMEPDSEGFLYPRVEMELCTNCHLCTQICPILRPVTEEPRQQSAWLVCHRNRETVRRCTSGGVFTAIAEAVLDRGGVVYGAALGSDFRVTHRAVRTQADLPALRGSKYVQSDTGSTFREAEGDLQAGRNVVYSGTLCQIEGFRRYLGKDYSNLLLVDVVCRAVPSPLIWERYVEYLRRKYGNFDTCHFRDKRPYGYQMSVLSAYSGEQQVYRGDISMDKYLRAFFSDLSDRPSCYVCSFKKRWRVSDLTLWDCLNPGAFTDNGSGFSERDGVSCVLAHTEKGYAAVTENANLRLLQVDADALCASAREMTHSVSDNPRRDEFFRDAEAMDGPALFEKWLPVGIKNRAEHMLRVVLARTGLTAPVKSFAKVIIRNHKR